MDKQEIIEFIDNSICRTYENIRSSDIDNAEEQIALNNSLIKKYLYQLDEPEITIGEAWGKIAEEYPYTPGELSSFLNKFLIHGNPEKVEIPQFVADWIERIKIDDGAVADITGGDIFRIIVDMSEVSAFNPASNIHFNDYEITDELVNYCNGHEMEFLKALINGYTVNKEPMWVVKSAQGSGYLIDYKLRTDSEILNASKNNAYQFDDKQKAEAVATLVGGTVEEWSE
ncbi:DUF1642 domain-containing protein [Tetragenococcus koreensis]|uniref:DUF1642 domain-containing protein n=1 Tax=Tetragenococcus koreensis TaxID=290335 RepID=UPI0011946E21|nr:DUF1642 domain-containing protein [Tetragenococcus koreensis]GEN89982.1 hypothetical protein TKO01_00280 [Tetragenococcus koreensis]